MDPDAFMTSDNRTYGSLDKYLVALATVSAPAAFRLPVCGDQYMYSYTLAGLPATKRLQMNQSMTWMSGFQQITQPRLLNLDASYNWDDEGRMTSVTYPNTTQLSGDYYPVQQAIVGPTYSYGFDSMHRPSTLTDQMTAAQVVGGVQYGAANELKTLNAIFTASTAYESRTYNPMLQMTDL